MCRRKLLGSWIAKTIPEELIGESMGGGTPRASRNHGSGWDGRHSVGVSPHKDIRRLDRIEYDAEDHVSTARAIENSAFCQG